MSRQFNKVRTAITLDPEVHEYVSKLAEKEDRSVSQQINKILKDFIKRQEGES
jgi:predicted transcriptional regulator